MFYSSPCLDSCLHIFFNSSSSANILFFLPVLLFVPPLFFTFRHAIFLFARILQSLPLYFSFANMFQSLSYHLTLLSHGWPVAWLLIGWASLPQVAFLAAVQPAREDREFIYSSQHDINSREIWVQRRANLPSWSVFSILNRFDRWSVSFGYQTLIQQAN